MKLSFAISRVGPDEWTLDLNREDTGEHLYTLRGLRTEAEARHAAESMRAAVHTAAVLLLEDLAR